MWTKSYHGVQHLDPAPKGYQITVCDYGEMVEATVLALSGATPFTPFREACFRGIMNGATALERALKWGEEQARILL